MEVDASFSEIQQCIEIGNNKMIKNSCNSPKSRSPLFIEISRPNEVDLIFSMLEKDCFGNGSCIKLAREEVIAFGVDAIARKNQLEIKQDKTASCESAELDISVTSSPCFNRY